MAVAGSLYSLLILLLLAPAADVWTFENAEGQSVGYSSTLNWAIAFTLVTPFFYFFLLRAVREVDRLPRRLADSEMLLDEDLKPHPRAAQVMSARWTAVQKRYASWWLTLSLLGIAQAVGEWIATSVRPLVGRSAPAEFEYDWAVAHIDGNFLERLLNACFSFLVFLQQAWMLSLIAYLIFFVLSVTALVTELRKEGRAVRLFPSVTRSGEDPRLGYQHFSGIFSNFLFAGLFLYTHFFVSRLWNAFLHPAEGEPRFSTIWDLIKEPLVRGVDKGGEQGLSLRELLVENLQTIGALNFSGLAVSIGAVILLTLSLALLIFIMRRSAVDARDELLAHGPGRRSAERLRNMALWPLRYPGLNTLAALGLLGAVCMLAYRLGVFFVGMVLLASCGWAVRQLGWKPRANRER